MVRSTGSPAASTAIPSLHTMPERLVHRAERVGAQGHGTEDLARPHVDLDPAARPRPPGAVRPGRCRRRARRRAPRRGRGVAAGGAREHGPRRQHLGPARAAQVGRHRRPGDVDHLDLARRGSTPAHGRQRLRGRPSPPCGRRGRPRCRRRGARGPGAGAWARAARRPRGATARGRRHRWRRRAPGRRPGTGLWRLPPKAPPLASGRGGALAGAGTSWRRARRRPARPRSSAA